MTDKTSISDRSDPHVDLTAAMLNSLIGNTVVNSFNPMFDLEPRVTLTVKATQTKTIHITEFLPEDIQKKRFPKLCRVDAKEGSEPCVLYQEAPMSYEGITIDIWGAANVRLLNHLLLTGYLARQDIENYLAYTAHMFDLAERYMWSGILSFDMQYRELQAKHSSCGANLLHSWN